MKFNIIISCTSYDFFYEKEAFGGADVALFVIGGKRGVSRDKELRILSVKCIDDLN